MGADASKPSGPADGGPAGMTEEEYRQRSISKMDSEMRKKYAQGRESPNSARRSLSAQLKHLRPIRSILNGVN
jgi:hypothetical protein